MKTGRVVLVLALFSSVATVMHGMDSPHGKTSLACEQCHSTEGWEMSDDASFEHGAIGYVLEGSHRDVNCIDCHTSLEFSKVAVACADCHDDVHREELGSECERCHTVESWDVRRLSIDPHVESRFPLVGVHAVADCEACHGTVEPMQFAATPTECVGCHVVDLLLVSDPDHSAAGFSSDCETCHSPLAMGWTPAELVHEPPLVGVHATLSCEECHRSGYSAEMTECIDCHRDDFVATTEPAHVDAEFPEDCVLCHSTEAWSPAEFAHDPPLVGAHVTLACAECHADGYVGTPTGCVDCHRDDFVAVTEPDHVVAGFSEDCTLCHGQSDWSAPTWHEAWFPIESGRHRTVWNTCADCHLSTGDYIQFECIFCHDHRQSETDSEHREVQGYIYESIACYECHPRGTE